MNLNPERILDLITIPCPVCGSDACSICASGMDYEYRTCANRFHFVRCAHCKAVYLNPRPRPGDLSVIYPDNYYSFAADEKNTRRNRLVQVVWDMLEKRRIRVARDLLGDKPASIIDIGCGNGRLLGILRRYGNPDWSLTGIEYGLPGGHVRNVDGIHMYSGLYEDHMFDEAPFDLAFAQQVIEHAYEPERMLAKIHDELAPGGFAVLDTPNYQSLDRWLFSSGTWGGYHFPRHMTLFTPDTFGALARKCGFAVQSVSSLISPVFWVLSIHNILRKAGAPLYVTKHIHFQAAAFLAPATMIDSLNLLLLRKTSNMRIVIRKQG